MTSWQHQLAELRETLVAEFGERATETPAELLAAFVTARGRYELWLEPDSATPRLLLHASAGVRRVLDFADQLVEDQEFLMGSMALTDDGRLLAYTVDVDGSDRYQLRVVELDAAPGTRTVRSGVSAAVGWHDGELVFTEPDAALVPSSVARISPDGNGYRVLCQAGPGEYLDLSQASDGRTVVISRESHAGNHLLLLPARASTPIALGHSQPGDQLQFDTAVGLDWLLYTSPGQPDRLLLRRDGSEWQPHSVAAPDTHWDQLTAVAGAALVVERQGGGQRLVVLTAGPGSSDPVGIGFGTDDGLAAISVVPGFDPTGTSPTVVRESWQSPARLYRISVADRRAHSMEEHPTAEHLIGAEPIDARRIATEPMAARAPSMRIVRLRARSADGTEVPLTLMCPLDQPAPWPTVLYGYGAYGVALDPMYTPFRLSLLERGIAFAVAHVRGGGDLGRPWHDAGRQAGKLRAIEDYLACARHLVEEGWAAADGLVARSRSAGAAVVGAALNRAPELFTAAVLEMPFVDCLRTLSDPAAALTELEWAEWGNPLVDEQARARIASWSPVDNVRGAAYPAMLIVAGLADARVSVEEARRYSEAIRAHSTSGRPVFLTEVASGHLGHSEVSEDWYGEAEVLAFIIDRLGRTQPVRIAEPAG